MHDESSPRQTMPYIDLIIAWFYILMKCFKKFQRDQSPCNLKRFNAENWTGLLRVISVRFQLESRPLCLRNILYDIRPIAKSPMTFCLITKPRLVKSPITKSPTNQSPDNKFPDMPKARVQYPRNAKSPMTNFPIYQNPDWRFPDERKPRLGISEQWEDPIWSNRL